MGRHSLRPQISPLGMVSRPLFPVVSDNYHLGTTCSYLAIEHRYLGWGRKNQEETWQSETVVVIVKSP